MAGSTFRSPPGQTSCRLLCRKVSEYRGQSHPMGTDAEPPPLSAPSTQLTICGFWRRIVALVIDYIVLWLFGEVLGLFLFDFFAHLGGWGRLVGFGVALVYFA